MSDSSFSPAPVHSRPGHPDLRPYERVAVLLSDPDPLPEEEVLGALKNLRSPEDGFRAVDLMKGHQIIGHAWYHLKKFQDRLFPEVFEEIRGCYYECCEADIWQEEVLGKLAAAFAGQGVRVAFVKGILLHRQLYGERPIPRGAADIDWFVFGGEEAQRRTERIVKEMGFRFSLHRAENDPTAHDKTFVRKTPGDFSVACEPHRFPSDLHVDTKEGRILMEWFENQRVPAASNPSSEGQLPPVLAPAACLLHLSINLVKDQTFRLRTICDIRLHLRRYGDSLDWKGLEQIAAKSGTTAALRLALDLAGDWERRSFSGMLALPFASKLLRSRLTLPVMVRSVVSRGSHETAFAIGGIHWDWCSVLFGWPVFFRQWWSYERKRFFACGKGFFQKTAYLAVRPFVLLSAILRFGIAVLCRRQ